MHPYDPVYHIAMNDSMKADLSMIEHHQVVYIWFGYNRR